MRRDQRFCSIILGKAFDKEIVYSIKRFSKSLKFFATTVSKVGGVKIYNDCKMAIISVQEQSTLDFNLNSNNKENKQNNFSLLS